MIMINELRIITITNQKGVYMAGRPKKEVPVDVVKKVIKMREEGRTIKEISDETGLTIFMVNRIWRESAKS